MALEAVIAKYALKFGRELAGSFGTKAGLAAASAAQAMLNHPSSGLQDLTTLKDPNMHPARHGQIRREAAESIARVEELATTHAVALAGPNQDTTREQASGDSFGI